MSSQAFWAKSSLSRSGTFSGSASLVGGQTGGAASSSASSEPGAQRHMIDHSDSQGKEVGRFNDRRVEGSRPTVTINIPVNAPDKDKVYRWLIGRNGTNIKLMQSTGVSIQVDRKLGNISLEGDIALVEKVRNVILRLASDTASSSVGCGGKKVMTAIKRLIADCAAYHATQNEGFGVATNSVTQAHPPAPQRSHGNVGYAHKQNPQQAAKTMPAPGNPNTLSQLGRRNATSSMGLQSTSSNTFLANRASFSDRPSHTDQSIRDLQNGLISNKNGTDTVTKTIYVTAPDKDKVYRWLIGRNGTNIKLMQSTGVLIQVDRKCGTVLLEGKTALVSKVQSVIERLMYDTASPLVGCGGKKVMTAIKRLIADCASVHASSRYSNETPHGEKLRLSNGGGPTAQFNSRSSVQNQHLQNVGGADSTKSSSQMKVAPTYICTIQIAVGEGKREKAYSRLIGRGGNVIRRMERHSSAEIKVDKHDGSVLIRGKKDAVEKARMMVSSVLTGVKNDDFRNEFDDLLQFPPGGNLMGSVMMPRLLDAELDNLYAQIPRDFFTESGHSDSTPFAKDGTVGASGVTSARSGSRFSFGNPDKIPGVPTSNRSTFETNGQVNLHHGFADTWTPPSTSIKPVSGVHAPSNMPLSSGSVWDSSFFPSSSRRPGEQYAGMPINPNHFFQPPLNEHQFAQGKVNMTGLNSNAWESLPNPLPDDIGVNSTKQNTAAQNSDIQNTTTNVADFPAPASLWGGYDKRF
jgi:rRNA processing protein Krr1/Pno1